MDLLSQSTINLVDSIYDTQMDPNLWVPVQRQLCASTGGVGSHILLFDENRAPIETLIHSSADQSAAAMMEDDYFHWYHQFDDYRIAQAVLNGRHVAVTNDEITPDGKKRTCPLYNEYFRYYDVEEQLIFGTPLSNGSSLAVVHARPRDMGIHSEEERQLFVWLSQHVMRATELSVRLNKTFDGSNDLLEIISQDNRAVVVVDKDNRLLWMSDNARRGVLSTSDIRVVRNKLVFESQEQSVKVEKLVSAACDLSNRNKNRCGFLSLSVGGVNYALSVLSSSAQTSLFSSSTPVAVLVFQDPLSISLPRPEVIQMYLGLTPAEVELSLGLAKGYSLNEYAEATSRSVHTVRSALKIIMTKAGVRKQSDLIQLIRGLC